MGLSSGDVATRLSIVQINSTKMKEFLRKSGEVKE
jgi:hypothetical protein